MKRREKLKDIIKLIELCKEKHDTIDTLSVAVANNLKDSEDRLTEKLSDCNNRLNKFLDEELDDYAVSLTTTELAKIINILCLYIYNHEENQVQDIIQIKDKLKNALIDKQNKEEENDIDSTNTDTNNLSRVCHDFLLHKRGMITEDEYQKRLSQYPKTQEENNE